MKIIKIGTVITVLILLLTVLTYREAPPEKVSESEVETKETKKEEAERRRDLLTPASIQKPSPYQSAQNSPDGKKLTTDSKLVAQQEKILSEGYGVFPAVDLENMNPHKEHVVAAFQNPSKNSGAISIVGKRQKFDPDKYRHDPSYYLDSVEPGRAFDTAQAGEGIQALTRGGASSYETEQEKPVTLTAKGEPGMPVSFTAFDGGQFQNGLSFITLQANASGYASAEFTPTMGVINQCRIRAASPVNSGTLQWIVLTHLKSQEN